MPFMTTLLIMASFKKDRTPSDVSDFNKIIRECGRCIEEVEENFGIEFSCGDGKYLSQIGVDDPELRKYDGHVSFEYPPLNRMNKEVLPIELVFRVQEDPKTLEVRYQIGLRKKSAIKWIC